MKKQIKLILLFVLFVNLSIGQNQYNSLFWEISGNGLKKKSYLYGTFHTKDQRVFEFSKNVKKAFKKADIYAMELNMDSIDQSAVMQSMLMDSNLTLNDLLTEEEYNRVNRFFLDSLGMPLFMLRRLQPMMVAQMISLKDLNSEQENALDLYWFTLAKKQKKQCVGLEKMEEQTNAIKSIPVREQAKQLLEAVDNYGKKEEGSFDVEQMLEVYRSGNLDSLTALTESVYDDSLGGLSQFNENFIYSRNSKMADRAEQYFKKGSVFVAVGAAHLPGEKGVIELLRNKGYKVVPLPFAKRK